MKTVIPILQNLYDSSTLDYNIIGVTAIVNGSLKLNESKKQIGRNSLLYITENADFGELNGNIDNSKLYIGSNAKFDNINGGIKVIQYYLSVDDATFGAVNGGVDKSSLDLCWGKYYLEDLQIMENNIISQVKSPEAYQNKCLGRRQ